MGSSSLLTGNRNFEINMKLTGLILLASLGVCLADIVDISPYVFRIKRSPQTAPTRIFTNSNQVNSAAAGALFGSLLSFGQNQIFNPCTRNSNRNQNNKNTNTKIFGGLNFGNFLAGTAAGYGSSQLATSFLNGCG